MKVLHISNDFCLTKVHSMLYRELDGRGVEQTMLKKILLNVGGRDDLKRRVRIGRGERRGTLDVGFVRVPLELEGMELSVSLFYVVNLLLLLRAPEPVVGKTATIAELFHTLGDAEVLPQCAYVGAALHLRKVADDSVADAQIPEIYLAALLQFVAQVTAEAAQTEDDIRLFQYINITLHSLRVEANELPHLVVAYLTAYLVGQGLHKAHHLVWLANAVERKDVAVEIAAGQLFQHCVLVAWRTDNLRIVAIDHAMGQQPQLVEQVGVGYHLCKGERKQRELTLAPSEWLAYLACQVEGAAAGGDHLYAWHLVGDEFQTESNIVDALCLVNDNNAVRCKEGAQARGGDALEERLRVGVVAVQPQHVAALRQHLAEKCGLAYLAGSHNDNGLLRVKQGCDALFDGSVYHSWICLFVCKDNQKTYRIQKSYNIFGIKSKNLIIILDLWTEK